MGLLATLLGKILGKGAPSTQTTAASGTQPPPTGSSTPPVAAANPPAGASAPAPVVDVNRDSRWPGVKEFGKAGLA